MNPLAIGGALLGGLLSGGGSKQSGTQTTTTAPPAWAASSFPNLWNQAQQNIGGQPYIPLHPLQQQGMQQMANFAQAPHPLISAAQQEAQKTLSGGYLTQEGLEPYIANLRKGIDSAYSSAGRFGSGAHMGSIGEAVTNAVYPAERQRMQTAMYNAPGLQSQGMYGSSLMNQVGGQYRQEAERFAGFPGQQTSALAQMLTALTGGQGQVSQPLYENRGAGMLGGALGGYKLASALFGGK